MPANSPNLPYPGVSEDLLCYWKQQLSDIPLLPELPIDHPRKQQLSHRENYLSFTLSMQCSDSLTRLSKECGTTLFTTLLASFNILLHRYTSQKDVVVVYPAPGAFASLNGANTELKNNKLALRTDLSGNPTFYELLRREQVFLFEANAHRDILLETVENALYGGAGLNNNSPFKVMFEYFDASDKHELLLKEAISTLKGNSNSKTTFEIILSISDSVEGLRGELYYNADLYAGQTIARMIVHLKELLSSIIANPHQKIGSLNMLTSREKQQLLIEFNDTAVSYPRDKCISTLFEEQAAKTPHATATFFDGQKLTYKELNEQSNRLAHYLKKKCVKIDTLVPICIERSAEMIIGILGILKAGAAYVPIDPDYPLERIKYMLEDTGATIVLSNKASGLKATGSLNIEVIELDTASKMLQSCSSENMVICRSPQQLAYVIYTSGSTGKPKGVMVEHRALADHCHGLIKSAGLEECGSFALFSPLVFDAGHSIIYTAFLLGAALHIMPKRLIMESDLLKAYFYKHEIDCIKIVPSLWLSFANENNLIVPKKAMIFGGEVFSKSILDHLARSNYQGNIFNHYGPTEATIGKCIHKVNLKKKYATIPIGKPFSNTSLYIVDQYFQLSPVGIAGELYIAGEGLARAYLNEPDLTAQKFIADRFSPVPSTRMYKTGDKARWLPDGNIEYLGRIDQQVKISGHRIEPGEIESVLGEHPAMQQAVVMAREDAPGDKKLVAYYVLRAGYHKQDVGNLRRFLSESLPDYMVPAIFMMIKTMPLTSNDKVDRKALPVPAQYDQEQRTVVAPRDVIEIKLVKIFRECLKNPAIGVTDNYFDMGASSMQAYQIFAIIKKSFGTQLPMSVLFRAPTIEQLAKVLGNKPAAKSFPCLVPIQPNGLKTPLFLMHAGAGTVLFYKELADHLSADQPVYGLQAKGIDDMHPYHKTVEEMATHYINEMRTINADGPYLLGGYCFGGVIAFEIAQQLTRQGKKVSLLALFNSKSPTYVYSAPPADAAKKISTKKVKRDNLTLRIARRIKRLLKPRRIKWMAISILYPELIKSRKRFHKMLTRAGIPVPGVLQKYFFLDNNSDIAKAYKAGVYPGKMILFRSPLIYADTQLGWGKLVAGGMETIDIPGKHKNRREIMNEPFVADTAAQLNSHLKELLDKEKIKGQE